MGYYPEDFFNEPSEFDIQVHEFKKTLSSSIKEEVLAEMERLRKENAELQEVKANFEDIKRNYERRKMELESEYQRKLQNVRRERLRELMGDLEVELYSVATKSEKIPKCDKCDDERKIHYKTPLGKETYEYCDCDAKIQIYQPISAIMYEFSIRDGKGNAWYKINDSYSREAWLTFYEDSIHGSKLITSEEQFEKVEYAYRTLFPTQELAQKFCDFKNKDKEVVSRNVGRPKG